uniref:Glutathione S-transferase C-terminal domain-containing protein n=1 Tax=Malurus cyaneus samueli TaxID=2593467 RepID=A0A8C5TL46_9PASS
PGAIGVLPKPREKLKPAYLEQLPKKLQVAGRRWITFVDFLAYDVLDQQRMFVPDCPELQGNLARFLQRFEVSGDRERPLWCPHPHP